MFGINENFETQNAHIVGRDASRFFVETSPPRLLSGTEVMLRFGYKNRSSFWQFIKSRGVPHIRFNQRKIMFDPRALDGWLARRSVGRHRP